MSAKDALIIALKAETQNLRSERDALRSWLSARLPKITSNDNTITFDDGTNNFQFELGLELDYNFTYVYLQTSAGRKLASHCRQVLFEQNCIIFLRQTADGSYEEIFRLEILETGYTALKKSLVYERLRNENPLFNTLELEQRLREFCVRHNLL